VVAPLLLIGTVVLSFAATLGLCSALFTKLLGYPAMDASFALYAFVFLIAFGIDYNIFLMARVREEAARLETREATLHALRVTGGVITAAGVVLAAAFVVLTVLPLVPLIQLGVLVAVGVVIDTVIVRSLLVPALAHNIGQFIWWPRRGVL
jgi:RND superfamily putative drug exporter